MSTAVKGVEKPIERLRPGAWIFAHESGGEGGKWVRIHSVLSLTHESGRKATEVRGEALDGELIMVREWNNTLITGLTKTEARKAGLCGEPS